MKKVLLLAIASLGLTQLIHAQEKQAKQQTSAAVAEALPASEAVSDEETKRKMQESQQPQALSMTEAEAITNGREAERQAERAERKRQVEMNSNMTEQEKKEAYQKMRDAERAKVEQTVKPVEKKAQPAPTRKAVKKAVPVKG
ncbi:MAG TPA: hypothetical protein PKW54_00545 [Ferruginibacter sp.]|nr:hypothetical protein [Ferruginibacter sp.]